MAPVTIARFVQELEKLKQVSDAEKLKPQEYDSRLARIIQELREKGMRRASTLIALPRPQRSPTRSSAASSRYRCRRICSADWD